MTEAHVCEQLAQCRYLVVEWLGIEPATFQTQVRRRNHYTTKPHLSVSVSGGIQMSVPLTLYGVLM